MYPVHLDCALERLQKSDFNERLRVWYLENANFFISRKSASPLPIPRKIELIISIAMPWISFAIAIHIPQGFFYLFVYFLFLILVCHSHASHGTHIYLWVFWGQYRRTLCFPCLIFLRPLEGLWQYTEDAKTARADLSHQTQKHSTSRAKTGVLCTNTTSRCFYRSSTRFLRMRGSVSHSLASLTRARNTRWLVL